MFSVIVWITRSVVSGNICWRAILTTIPVLGVIIRLHLVFAVLFTYRLFEIYTSQAILYTVLSVLLCLSRFFLFIIRNNSPISSTPQGVQPPNNY